MSDNEAGERDFAVFCSGMLLFIAAFAVIGVVTICRWIAGVV